MQGGDQFFIVVLVSLVFILVDRMKAFYVFMRNNSIKREVKIQV